MSSLRGCDEPGEGRTVRGAELRLAIGSVCWDVAFAGFAAGMAVRCSECNIGTASIVQEE